MMSLLKKVVCGMMLFLVLSLAVLPSSAHAQLIPVSGYLIFPVFCTCSGGVLLYIYDNTTRTVLQLVFQYGYSRLNSMFNIFTTGVSMVGSYTPGGICTIYAGTTCVNFGTPQGMITGPYGILPGVGTSLLPAI